MVPVADFTPPSPRASENPPPVPTARSGSDPGRIVVVPRGSGTAPGTGPGPGSGSGCLHSDPVLLSSTRIEDSRGHTWPLLGRTPHPESTSGSVNAWRHGPTCGHVGGNCPVSTQQRQFITRNYASAAPRRTFFPKSGRNPRPSDHTCHCRLPSWRSNTWRTVRRRLRWKTLCSRKEAV